MIKSYCLQDDVLRTNQGAVAAAVWIDLFRPTPEEESAVASATNSVIPTEEDMREIETSSRLYSYGDVTYMTALLPANADGGDPVMGPVCFVLTPSHLVTVRYHDPRVFTAFPPRAHATRVTTPDPLSVLIAMMEAVIDRQADILERATADIDVQSRGLFKPKESRKPNDYQAVLEAVGRMGNLNSNIRDSLLTLDRLVGYLAQVLAKHNATLDLHERTKTLHNDVKSLTDHANFIASKITFLLDATLGMINIDQTNISKTLSLAAVFFLPATLIASIYGMNFAHMPVLEWQNGFTVTIGLMVGLAVLTFGWFKYKGWL
jgi:magnesium transporter